MKSRESKFGGWKPLIKILILIGICTLAFRLCSYVFSLTFITLPNEKERSEVPYSQFVRVIDKTFEQNIEPLLVETEKGKLYYFTKDTVFETEIPNSNKNKDDKKINRSDSSAKILETYNMPYDYYKFSWTMFFIFLFVVLTSVSFIFIIFMVMDFKGQISVPETTLGNEKEPKKSKFITETPKVSLSDVGGLSPQVTDEIEQAIMLFHKHKDITTFKIKPVNGILLYGPPGTGKTMLAKAIAKELDSKYFQLNGPEFAEKFVGVGPARVRELFQEAKKHQPSIIFIDEIDAIGFKRDSDQNSEIRNTLNQLLIELNDIQHQQVLFIASTNHPNSLDPALVRAGRFDYKINIDLPDIKGRKEIIDIKTKNIPMDEHLINKLYEVARSMYRMSGADIDDVFQKAQISALKSNRTQITYEDVQESIERVILGTKGRITHPELVVRRVAYHEAGHALLSSLFYPSSIQKATIVPHSGSLGLVLTKETEANSLKTKTDLLKQINILLAGGVSEEIYFEEHSIGVSQDFEQAKKIMKSMVVDLGMTLDGFSFTTKKDEDLEMKKIINHCFEETKKIINKHKDKLDEIAQTLIKNETMTGDEIDTIVHKKIAL